MRRRAGILFIFGAAVPLVMLVSSAWACGVLATLKAAPSTTAVGATVQASGSNYNSDMAQFTPVSIRLDSRTGPALATATPVAGKINPTFQVPAGTSGGDHLVMATQNRISDGTPKAGTPGRTTVRVQGAAAAGSTPVASPWNGSKPGAPGGSTISVDPRGSGDPALLGIGLSLALLFTGVTLVARDRAPRRTLLGA